MQKKVRKASRSQNKTFAEKHRYEHWLVDNQVYFITARCRDRYPALELEEAKQIFWDRFTHYTHQYGFTPWVTSVLDNHYHTPGYLKYGENLPPMMQRIHGSTAKLINDLLQERRPKFWRDERGKEYFDGCIRNEKQARLAYRYTLHQSQRHGVVENSNEYPHTRVELELETAIRRALELQAFLEGVPYKRYARKPNR